MSALKILNISLSNDSIKSYIFPEIIFEIETLLKSQLGNNLLFWSKN